MNNIPYIDTDTTHRITGKILYRRLQEKGTNLEKIKMNIILSDDYKGTLKFTNLMCR